MVVAPSRMPSLRELTLDADALPPRVLPAETDHQGPQLWVDGRAAGRSAVVVRPLPPDELPGATGGASAG